MTAALVLLTAAFVPMAFEAARSRRNERTLRASGAIEPPGDVYALMQIAYPASFIGIAAEGWIRGARLDASFTAGTVVFGLAKVLKYWAIRSLGPRWTFRVLVPPRAPRIAAGPYRWLRHPNYLSVAGELAGAALMAGAPVAGILALVIFGSLMLARIRVEERALNA